MEDLMEDSISTTIKKFLIALRMNDNELMHLTHDEAHRFSGYVESKFNIPANVTKQALGTPGALGTHVWDHVVEVVFEAEQKVKEVVEGVSEIVGQELHDLREEVLDHEPPAAVETPAPAPAPAPAQVVEPASTTEEAPKVEETPAVEEAAAEETTATAELKVGGDVAEHIAEEVPAVEGEVKEESKDSE